MPEVNFNIRLVVRNPKTYIGIACLHLRTAQS